MATPLPATMVDSRPASGGSSSTGAGAGKVTVGGGIGASIIQFVDQLLTLLFGGHGGSTGESGGGGLGGGAPGGG